MEGEMMVTAPDPPTPGVPEYLKSKYEKELDEWLEARKQQWANDATELALNNTRDDAFVTAETTSLAAIQTAYITTTQTSLDRVLTRANVLTASVGTIITLYTALLAFVYTKADTGTG